MVEKSREKSGRERGLDTLCLSEVVRSGRTAFYALQRVSYELSRSGGSVSDEVMLGHTPGPDQRER